MESFRHGTDLVKAKALGAKAVFVRKTILIWFDAMGIEGVKAYGKYFQKEMDITVALCAVKLI